MGPEVIDRVVKKSSSLHDHHISQRIAMLVKAMAMTVDEARSVLGLGPGASDSDVRKAQRILSLANHPDQAADPEDRKKRELKMVAINVAADILLGRRSPTTGRPNWTPDTTYNPPPRREPPKPIEPDYIMEGQTFEQAMASSGVPAGTEWKFVSLPEFFWEKSFYPGHRIWVVYGRTESKHVLLAIKERGESSGTIPTEKGQHTKIMEDWQTSEVDQPLTLDLNKFLTKWLKLVGSEWADGVKVKGPKKYIQWPGGHVTQAVIKKIPYGGGVNLKDILRGTDLISDEDSSVAGRKTVVEMYFKRSPERQARMKAQKGKIYVYDAYDFYLRINGAKDFKLEDATIEKLSKSFIPWAIGWNNIGEGRPIGITRMRGGRSFLKYDALTALQELANSLTTEPSALHIFMEKAIEEWEPQEKKAYRQMYARIRLAMTVDEARRLLGVTPGASEEEINKAYRQLALKAHPDRPGGEEQAMVQLNVARDLLLKTPSGGSPSSGGYYNQDEGYGEYNRWNWPGQEEKKKPDPVRVSFEDAKKEAGVPSGVEWLFKTSTSYGGYGDTSNYGAVFYGKTGSKHVFVAAEYHRSQNAFTGEDVEVWWMKVADYPSSESVSNLAPKVIRQMYDQFPYNTNGFNAKVQIIDEGERGHFTEKLFRTSRKSIAFKDAMGILGLVDTEHKWVSDRKVTVELELKGSRFSEDGEEMSAVLTINGREWKLHKNTYAKMKPKALDVIFAGKYYYEGSKKILTRMPKGKGILEWMASRFTDEPDELRELLKKASEQMR